MMTNTLFFLFLIFWGNIGTPNADGITTVEVRMNGQVAYAYMEPSEDDWSTFIRLVGPPGSGEELYMEARFVDNGLYELVAPDLSEEPLTLDYAVFLDKIKYTRDGSLVSNQTFTIDGSTVNIVYSKGRWVLTLDRTIVLSVQGVQ